jgi:hypothetical protein
MRDEVASTDPGAKSAAEIEREVDKSRADVEQTLDAIQDRLSPGQLVDQAMAYFRNGSGGEFTRNLGHSVTQNPMPLALVAIGVGWMMMNQRPGHQRTTAPDYWDDEVDELDRYSTDATRPGVTSYPGAASYPGGAIYTAPGDDSGTDDDGGKGVGDRMHGLAEDAKNRLGEVGDRARELGSEARDRLSHARDDVSARAYRAREQACRHGRRVKQDVLRSLNEQPLVLGAIGLAVGAALGAALPPSETEDRLMGETRDEALRRAEKVGRAQAEKARSVAGAAVAAARDEADKQGLSTAEDQAAASSDRGAPAV